MIFGLLLWFNLTVSLQNGGVGDLNQYFTLPPITAEIELHAENEWMDLYGIYYNGMYHNEGLSFSPAQDDFTVGVSFTYGAFTFSYEHKCKHPVSWSPEEELSGVWGGHNKISLSMSSK